MPERNILTVYRKTTTDDDGARFHRFYCPINYDTAATYQLKGDDDENERLGGVVNSILDEDGVPVVLINEKASFLTHDYKTQQGKDMFSVFVPEAIIRNYGIRVGEHLDVTFEKVTSIGSSIDIFPRLLRYGVVSIRPQRGALGTSYIPEPLLETAIEDPFYENLLREINEAYGYGHSRSTLLLLRVLFENQIVDVLRAKYDTSASGLPVYYDKDNSRFHRFSALLKNFKDRVDDFKPYSGALDDSVFQRLDVFRDTANGTAHTIDTEIPLEYFKDRKTDINYLTNLMLSIRAKITEDSR